MVACIPNTPYNQKRIERHLPNQLPDSPDGKATCHRCAMHEGEEVYGYHWKGNVEEYHLKSFYTDVLEAFIRKAGFKGADYSRAGSSWYRDKRHISPKQ